MTVTQEDLLHQRVDDLEEWVGALSDLLSETRKDLAEARQQLRLAGRALDEHRHVCPVCGASDACLETGFGGPETGETASPAPRRRRLLRTLGL
jgi:hypothetical protein